MGGGGVKAANDLFSAPEIWPAHPAVESVEKRRSGAHVGTKRTAPVNDIIYTLRLLFMAVGGSVSGGGGAFLTDYGCRW